MSETRISKKKFATLLPFSSSKKLNISNSGWGLLYSHTIGFIIFSFIPTEKYYTRNVVGILYKKKEKRKKNYFNFTNPFLESVKICTIAAVGQKSYFCS